MPPEGLGRTSAHEWLARAKSNLVVAKQPKPAEVFWEDLCFQAQQAAEKALKAVLLFRGITFPYVHDIAELLEILERAGEDFPDEFWKADALSDYAVGARYPGGAKPVSEDDHREAVSLAEAIVTWADRILSNPQK